MLFVIPSPSVLALLLLLLWPRRQVTACAEPVRTVAKDPMHGNHVVCPMTQYVLLALYAIKVTFLLHLAHLRVMSFAIQSRIVVLTSTSKYTHLYHLIQYVVTTLCVRVVTTRQLRPPSQQIECAHRWMMLIPDHPPPRTATVALYLVLAMSLIHVC